MYTKIKQVSKTWSHMQAKMSISSIGILCRMVMVYGTWNGNTKGKIISLDVFCHLLFRPRMCKETESRRIKHRDLLWISAWAALHQHEITSRVKSPDLLKSSEFHGNSFNLVFSIVVAGQKHQFDTPLAPGKSYDGSIANKETRENLAITWCERFNYATHKKKAKYKYGYKSCVVLYLWDPY